MEPRPPHMSADEFREQGRRMVDWIADYLERVESMPVLSPAAPGDVLRSLPESPPESSQGWDDVFDDLDRVVLPGVTHWQSPKYFGYFPANASGPAVLAELLSAGLGVQGMLWSTSPACTELEMRMLDWLAEMIGLPAAFTFGSDSGGGVIQGTASEATLVALVAARKRAGHPGGGVVYASTQAHSASLKACMIAGLGPDALRLIDVDSALAMRPRALAAAMEADRAKGRTPLFVCATVGTTSSGAVDPVRAVGEVCRREGVWMHVDAAYAGAALVCPEHRGMIDGVELADSFNFNPHKWLLTNFDCSTFWVRDKAALVNALSVTPEYLRNAASESGDVVDYRDWQIPLGRRFRALKLWFVIRRYGVEGLRAHVRHHVELAERLEDWIREDDRFELAAPRSLSLLCFRVKGDDARSRALVERINASGDAFVTHTSLPDPDDPSRSRYVIRFAIGGTHTLESHVLGAWRCIQSLADRL